MIWKESDFQDLSSPWKEKLSVIFAKATENKKILQPIYYPPGSYNPKSAPEHANPDSCYLAWTFKDMVQLFALEIYPDRIAWFFQDQTKVIEQEAAELPDEAFKHFDIYEAK